jgi:hypothetical protein
MGAVAIQQMADRVAQLLEEKHSVRGRDLATKLRRAGGLLPRKVRDRAELLAVSAAKARNPKLLGQIDMGEVAEAYDACIRHLATVDPAKRRSRLVSDMVGSFGFGVLFLVLALIAFLAWRGYF